MFVLPHCSNRPVQLTAIFEARLNKPPQFGGGDFVSSGFKCLLDCPASFRMGDLPGSTPVNLVEESTLH